MRNASLAAAIAMALQLPSAWAQDTATLGEVIVTAQRRSENIQDVPVAVSTLSGEGLDSIRSGGDDIRFLSARLPSLNIESSFGPRISALLHPRPRQYRLRPERVAARVADL